MSVQRVYVIRHGLTDWNDAGRWQGSLQVPLNDHGREQAQLLANSLRHTPISAIYASDLSRAYETAEILGRALNLSPITDARLQEVNLGVFQGNTRAEIIEKFPDEWTAMHADWYDFRPPNGESRRQAQERMFGAWQDIIARDNSAEIALVSHGMAIRLLLLRLFEMHDEMLRHAEFGNTSITIVERNGDGWHLAQLADVKHLTPVDRAEHPQGEASE